MKTEVREINSSLAAIHILLKERFMCTHLDKCNSSIPDPSGRKASLLELAPSPKEEEWITIDETLHILKISRGTLYSLRKKRQITSIVKNRTVRLLKRDVEDALLWYSIPKGKV